MSDITNPSPVTTPISADAEATPPARRGVPGRALLLGAAGAALTALLVTQAEVVLSTAHIGYLQFPPVSLGLLLILVAVNRTLKRLQARWALSSSDVLVIYCMMLVAAMVSSHGVVQKLVPLLVMPRYDANISNRWQDKFDAHLYSGLVAYDPHNPHRQSVVDDYYQKMGRGGTVPWHAWLPPVLNWGVLIVLVLGAFLCLTAILRRQWVDNEKLAFPLAQIPLEIAADTENGTFFRNTALWLGVLLPVGVYAVKSLHMIQPTVPDITLFFTLSDYVTSPAFAGAANWFYFVISFAAIGFFFLLPSDVLFSIWFFFLLARAEQVVLTSYNVALPQMPMYPLPLFVGYQTIGAYLVLVGYFFWVARPHLRRVWAAAIGREKGDDANELLPYRTAVWGLIGSILMSTLWLWHLGMSPGLALLELGGLIFVIGIVLTRATAEAGMLMTETTFRPLNLYQMVAPIHGLGAQNLTMLAFMDSLFLRDQRDLLLTGMMDTARIADGTNIRRRSFVGVLALGIAVAFVVAVGLNISLPYHLGASNMDGYTEHAAAGVFYNYAPYFTDSPAPPAGASWQMPTFLGVGAVVTVLLSVLRATLFWWPLHPLGYALSGSWGTVQFWFPCLIAWVCKTLTLRFGGMGLYHTLRPFFLGLVIGEFGMATLLVLLNLIFHIPIPAFPWG